MFYAVTLINDSVDNSYAEIVPYQQREYVAFYVSSDNPKMKTHLESLLDKEAYILSPGRNEARFFSDGVVHLYPNTVYYMEALPEILAWHGYFVRKNKATHKSFSFMDTEWITLKASMNEEIYQNKKGERIVKYVPDGYVAVHSDGRVLAGGKYLHANIDKEGAEWTLVQNPYSDASSEERKLAQDYMDMGLQDYHPGVHEETYSDDGFTLDKEYKSTGTPLNEYYDDVPVQPASKQKLEEGKILYSPTSGYAIRSEYWPPNLDNYDEMEWYSFNDNGLSDEEKQMYASLVGEHPLFITGLDEGLVEDDSNLPVDDGILFIAPGTQDNSIELTTPAREEFNLDALNTSSRKAKIAEAKKNLDDIKDMTRERDEETGELRISDRVNDMKIKDLQGEAVRFRMEPYGYQKAGILALTETSQYEAYGGPEGWHGHYLNWTYGLGKTAVVAGANAVMRNRGHFEDGVHTTLVTAPNKNIFVWQSEIGKFLGEHAVVIDGARQDRIDQWEELLDQAREGTLPSFIIVGSSKFRYVKNEDAAMDEDEIWELDTDAQYMKLLANGGKSDDKNVPGKHVRAFVVDESGQYVNPDAGRHSALHEMVDAVYQNEGITWTLNGDISGNSATDTISEISFVNAAVRDNYLELANYYTKTNRDTERESKQMNRRIWQNSERLREFMRTYGEHIYPLDGRAVAGENFGFKRTEDLSAPLGKEWGKIYEEAASKMRRGMEQNQMKRTLGLMSLMVSASYGAIAPQRMLEYDLQLDSLLEGASERLSPKEFQKLRGEIEQYQQRVTDTTYSSSIGRLPSSDYNANQRNEIYKNIVSEENRAVLENVAMGWEAPVLTQIENQLKMRFCLIKLQAQT